MTIEKAFAAIYCFNLLILILSILDNTNLIVIVISTQKEDGILITKTVRHSIAAFSLILVLVLCIPFSAKANSNYGVNIDGSAYTEVNVYNNPPQCTWYCWGRAWEKCGVWLPKWGNAKDREAIERLRISSGCNNAQEIRGWMGEKCETAVRKALGAGISIRQLSRLTGISKAVIEQIAKM